MSYATSKLIVNAFVGNGAIDVSAALRTVQIANTNALNRREAFKGNAIAAKVASALPVHHQRLHKIVRRGCNQLAVLDLVN